MPLARLRIRPATREGKHYEHWNTQGVFSPGRARHALLVVLPYLIVKQHRESNLVLVLQKIFIA